MPSQAIKSLNTFVILLALGVVMLGAYTRLTDAGLGCPDWPGCYGQLVPSQMPAQLQQPQEMTKAWTEMAHRYAAGTLVGLIIALLLSLAYSNTRNRLTLAVSGFLLLLMAFQAALGMWTVTLRLLPVVVMGHLLGGMLIFASLIYLRAAISQLTPQPLFRWRMAVTLGLLILGLQIALGGWVSANYAGIACIGFPQCSGHWLPGMDWANSFNVFSSASHNYQGGLLNHPARVAIQMTHRLGALITWCYLVSLSVLLISQTSHTNLRRFASSLLVLVNLQCALGIANVVFFLPLWVAVLHNGCAALLLANLVVLRYLTSNGTTR